MLQRRMADGGKTGWAIMLTLTIAASNAQTFTTIKSFGIPANVTGFQPRSTLVQGADGTLYGTAPFGEGSVGGAVYRIQPDGSGLGSVKIFTNSIEGTNPYAPVTLLNNVLYGTTYAGGSANYGTIYRVNTDGSGFSVLRTFTGSDGAHPYGGMSCAQGVLYGTTIYGGSFGGGTVFKLNLDGLGYTVLKNFSGGDGAGPNATPIFSNGVIYGTTFSGGSSGLGTIFKMNADGTGYTILRSFTGIAGDGYNPGTTLILSESILYGTTSKGGTFGRGTVFKINTDGNWYAVLKSFDINDTDGATPYAEVTLAGSVLYGTTHDGGAFGLGTVFRLNTDGTGFAVLKNFAGFSDASGTYAGLVLLGDVLYGVASGGNGTVFKVNTDGTGFAVVKNFVISDGVAPQSAVTMMNGALYGTTYQGGSLNVGTVFTVNPDGSGYAVLKNFGAGNDAAHPVAGLTPSGNTLYGATLYGGSGYDGTIFKINTDGTDYTVLKNLAYSDGIKPTGDLALSNGVLYGTSEWGQGGGYGTLFTINTDGSGYTVLTNFNGLFGNNPLAGLTLSGSVMYGTASSGGPLNFGTVFKANTDGSGCVVMRNFLGSNYGDGSNPRGSLTLSGGVLYGTTYSGGNSNFGTLFRINTDARGYTVLKSFAGSDGANPAAGLTLSGNALYGTTFSGGSSNLGTVFQINTDGTSYTVLKNFTGRDGANPQGTLIFSGNTLYGTTSAGGLLGEGTVFKIAMSAPSRLIIQSLSNAIVLSWDDPTFALQAGATVSGAYTNVPGATSPYTAAVDGAQMFFRLIGN